MRDDLRTAFVTRQYMLSKDFEVYYYSDLHMKGAGSHSHNYYEFYFFVNGNITMVIDKNEYILCPGDLVVIPPGVPHYAIINDPEKYYERFVFWISTDYYDQLISTSDEYGYIVDQAKHDGLYIFKFDEIQFNALQSKIFSLIQEVHQERYGKETMINLYVSDLLMNINRSAYESKHSIKVKTEASLYEKLISYIDSHLTDDLSLDVLAEEFFVSKYHISHIFKENMGISIHKYVIKKRLNLFKDYIYRNDSINNAYLLCGFSDYSSFYRDFKKEYGISPNEYKTKIDKENSLYKFSEKDTEKDIKNE